MMVGVQIGHVWNPQAEAEILKQMSMSTLEVSRYSFLNVNMNAV